MKRIGLIGGLGPEATMDYYKEIIDYFNDHDEDNTLNYPEMIIYSVSLNKLLAQFNKKEYHLSVDYISGCIDKLEGAGADFVAITANTPHLIFNEIREKVNLPMISIVEATARNAKSLNLKRCGLFGTGFTMKATFYKDVFSSYGLEIVTPASDEIEVIHQKLFSEIELGIYKEKTRELLMGIIVNMIQREKIDSLILGCTEFPIMFREKEYYNIPFLNTTKIHVDEIVDMCLNDQ